MADKRLDQENVLTDFDYALIVKGTDVAKISKEDLAKVVGGLMFYANIYRDNLDNLKTPGFYLITNGVPGYTSNYVYMQVFRASSSDITIQIAYSVSEDKILQRSFNRGSWTSFKTK